MKNMILKGIFIIIISSMIINDCMSCPIPINIEFQCEKYALPVWGMEYTIITAYVTNDVPVRWNGSEYVWNWNTNGLGEVISKEQFSSSIKVYPSSLDPGTFNISVQAWDENNYSDSDSAQVDIYELLTQNEFMYIPCNNDDDNNNGYPDGEEDGPVENEDDLICVHFYTNPSPLTGWLYIYIPHYHQTGFRFWRDAAKTYEIDPENSDPSYYYKSWPFYRFPSSLYIERTGECSYGDPCPLHFGSCEFLEGYYIILNLSPIQAKIEDTTPSYVAYGNGMKIDYSVYVTDTLGWGTFDETPDSVKLYIKNGESIIIQIDLDCAAGNYTQNYDDWDGKDANGVYIEPGEYTLEVEVIKEGAKHSNEKNFLVLKLDKVSLSSDKALVSPVFWNGGDVNVGSPCDKINPEPALTIPYYIVSDRNEPNITIIDFTIDANSYFIPEIELLDLPTDLQYAIKWTKVSGPASGYMDDVNQLNAYYKNPKVGGVYELEFELPGINNTRTKLFIHLPLAGADMTSWLENEIKSIPSWAIENKHAAEDYYFSWVPYKMYAKTLSYWMDLSAHYFDYNLDPVSTDEKSPCPKYKLPVGSGDYTYVTVNGVVVHGVKINNMMWAVFGRAWGWSPADLHFGSEYNNWHVYGCLDTLAAKEAVILGSMEMYDWAQNGEGHITDVLTQEVLRLMQEPPVDDPNLHILWPSPDPLDPSKSDMERPLLPVPFPHIF